MKYIGMPMGMWAVFAGPFRRQLTASLGYDANTAKEITKKAKPQYRQIIAKLPEFEKGDRFQMNIVNCAMLGAFVCAMSEAGGRTEFVRKFTLASGGPYCDCGYKKKQN